MATTKHTRRMILAAAGAIPAVVLPALPADAGQGDARLIDLEREWRAALTLVHKAEREWRRRYDQFKAAHPEFRWGPGTAYELPCDRPDEVRAAENQAMRECGLHTAADDVDHDPLIDRLWAIRDEVYETPAEGFRGLRVKVRVFLQDYEGSVIDEEALEPIFGDIRRLAARAPA